MMCKGRKKSACHQNIKYILSLENNPIYLTAIHYNRISDDGTYEDLASIL